MLQMLTESNLQIALVGTLNSSVSLQPDGTTLVSNETRSIVTAAASTLEALPDTPISLSVRPELVDALNSSSDEDIALLARLQVSTSLQLLPATYVDVQPDELVAKQSTDVLTNQLRLGEDVLTTGFPGKSVNRDAWVQTSTLLSGGAQLLRNLGL